MELFGFGPHLMIEGMQANESRLDDLEFIRDVLNHMPLELDMNVVLEPHVSRMDGLTAQDSGITAVVIVKESHISLHTFPLKGFISVDIFSAQEFDVQKAVDFVVERFEVGRFETHLINRGREFPKNPLEIDRIVRGEREYLEARLG